MSIEIIENPTIDRDPFEFEWLDCVKVGVAFDGNKSAIILTLNNTTYAVMPRRMLDVIGTLQAGYDHLLELARREVE